MIFLYQLSIGFFFFLSLSAAFSPIEYYQNNLYDCGGSQYNTTVQYFCQTTYFYASIINTTNINEYYYKHYEYMPLNYTLDNAQIIYHDLVGTNNIEDTCRDYLTSFACKIAMPYCPNTYEFTQPWQLCRSECLYVKKVCPFMNMDCMELTDESSMCFRPIDSTTDIIVMTSGHRWLWPLNIALSIYYLGLLIFWHIQCSHLYNHCNSLQSAYTPSLYIKLLATISSIIVWWQIDYTEGLNYNTWSVVMICANLLFQTYFIANLLMFSKGWCIVTSNYIRNDWMHTYVMALLYYIAVCILNLFSIELYNEVVYHAYCIIITSFILLHVYFNISDSFQDCYQKMHVLNKDGLIPYRSPAYAKYIIFQILAFLIGFQYLLFILRHILLPILNISVLPDTYVFWDILLSEIAFAVLMTFFTVVFYPRVDCVLYTNLQGEDEEEISTMPSMKSLKSYSSRYFSKLEKVSEITVTLPDGSIYIGKRFLDKREIYRTPSPSVSEEEDISRNTSSIENIDEDTNQLHSHSPTSSLVSPNEHIHSLMRNIIEMSEIDAPDTNTNQQNTSNTSAITPEVLNNTIESNSEHEIISSETSSSQISRPYVIHN